MSHSLRFDAPSRLTRDAPGGSASASASSSSTFDHHRLLFFNTTNSTTSSTAGEANIAVREEHSNFETISFEEYASVAEECLEFVSTDTHLVGEVDGGDGDETREISMDPNVCSAYFQSTFVGCTNTNDIETSLQETNGTIIRGVVTFPYDLWWRQMVGYSEEESVATVEANMLLYLGGQLDFACDDPASGGIIGLSSNPIDNFDAAFGTCISDPPLATYEDTGSDGNSDSLQCIPMTGKMTYYVAITDDAARIADGEFVENEILDRISVGADEDAFVADAVVDVIIVDRNEIAIKNDGGGPSWPIIGAIIGGVVALLGLLLLLIFMIRRKKEGERLEAEQDTLHPFDVSDWKSDDVPDDYEINRDLGIVYSKSACSPDRTACTSTDDGCGTDESFISWIFGSNSEE